MTVRSLRRYDRWLTSTPIGRLQTWLTSVPGTMLYNPPAYRLHEELQVHADNRVLDIGCGRVALLQLLASHVKFEKPPVGIDVSRALLERVPADATAERLQATGTSLPLADGVFDVVTCGYETFDLDEDGLLALFREIRRVLTPGGIALVWDFASTGSQSLNAFHERLLAMGRGAANVRNYTTLSAYALEAGFEWVSNAHLRPYLFPPIPRVSIIIGKAPIGWTPEGMKEGLTPNTHANTLVAGVTEEKIEEPN